MSDPRAPDWLTTYTYNANNQVLTQVQPTSDGAAGGPVTRNAYDALGQQIAQTDARGNVTAQTLDRNGRVIEAHHADGGVEYTFYDTFGNKRATVDAMGNTTSYEYDKDNRLVATTYAPVTSYDSFANRPQNAHTDSLTLRASYDEAGRLLLQIGTDGSLTRYDYDAAGNIIRTTVPGGGVTQDTYDARGHKTSEIDANGAVATWHYDSFGQLQAHTDIGGAQYSYTYDAARQLTRQTNTRGQNLAYGYDRAGQQIRIDDLTLDQHTTYDYDLAGNHVREKTVQGGVVYQDNHLAYDALGRLRDIDDGHVHIAIDYDAMGNRTHITSHVMDSADHSNDQDKWYAYDEMNRQILVDGAHNGDADDASNLTATQGHRVTYDKNGNRIADTTWGKVVTAYGSGAPLGSDAYGNPLYGAQGYTSADGLVQTDYQYDALGRLTVTSENGLTLDQRDYDTGSRVLQSGNDGSLSLDYLKARYGGEGKAGNGAQTIYMSYDEAGRLNFEEVWNRDGTLAYDVRYNAYDPVGNVDQYTVVTDRGTSTETTNVYAPSTVRMEGYKQTGDHLISWTTERQDGQSETLLDVQGNPIGVRDVVQPSYNRDIVNDASGQALYLNQGGHVQRQLIVNGQVLGRYGQEITGSNDDGTARFGEVTDFNFSYQSIDATSASSGSRYTVAAGDTLQGIAQTLYGDSQLWYVIADANGLQSGQPLRIGQVLDIPAKVGTVHNNAQTYKPYDPSKITGDTAPHLPTPAGGGGNGCGGIGMIVMIIVAVVVSVFTCGAGALLMAGGMTALTGAGLGGIMAAGATAMLGGGALVGGFTATLAESMAAAAIGGAMGSIVSQGVGMAMGMQQKFSWAGVATSAIAAGVTAGVGGEFFGGAAAVQGQSALTGSALAKNLTERAIVSATISQGVNMAVGLQKSFSWTAVAAAGAGAAVGAGVTNVMPAAAPGDFTQKLMNGTVAGIAAGTTASLLKGGRVVIEQVAADAFGNALANDLVDSMQAKPPLEGPPLIQDEGNGRLKITAVDGAVTYARVQAVQGPWDPSLSAQSRTQLADSGGGTVSDALSPTEEAMLAVQATSDDRLIIEQSLDERAQSLAVQRTREYMQTHAEETDDQRIYESALREAEGELSGQIQSFAIPEPKIEVRELEPLSGISSSPSYFSRSLDVLSDYSKGISGVAYNTAATSLQGLKYWATQPLETGHALLWGAGQLTRTAMSGWQQIYDNPGQAWDATLWLGGRAVDELQNQLSGPDAGKFVGRTVASMLPLGSIRSVGSVARSLEVESVVTSSAVNPLRAGQLHETEQLAQLGIDKNTTVFRPSAEQIDSAAFKVIAGDAKYTKGGQATGTIFDGVSESGYLEIKGGQSELNSTYQLRLQTYKAAIDNKPLTIQTTRPVNPEFQKWLDSWGVKVVKPGLGG